VIVSRMPSVAVTAPAAVPRHCVEALEQRLAAVADAADEQLSSVHLTLRLEQSCFVVADAIAFCGGRGAS